MDERQALMAFGALSQETRLKLLRLLVVAGPDGIAAGSLAEQVEVSPSNVSFHLKELERAGLVGTRRDARSIVYSAEYDALSALIRFLMEDCCSGRPEICAPALAAPCCRPGEGPRQ
ncbi:transcriptional regulator [Mesorhizobium sp. M1A.F.Ca.IN.022.07.1.1]|uniref:ArsR/SmtB family transcription factor n=1 Tax=unclassified Mesorhizobium TaxID=325217 RepID=UPI0007FF7CE2|nr:MULTISPECIES: metalloregulator ArsR/SmtB family transcription factor [unclassified Mesorhizobium]TGV91985.1 transcriptional regulator [Mesorhizobium sp. M00.F.Ca.ET.158.01.1.1]WIE90334.1 metalloregulator ArsR/SmtB family transcription factor [Mesorhizobium sp. WSM4875]AZO58590.1 transcriptional regulator [Mesorhizobium sp. M1A.F.Ca.IN.022.06.1.1]MCT2579300.1 metalloregulator ArsR/SmtB family transcription factor [Mesorhizobium sp. P13.3]MDF3168527.1 metalloregulator ArsR/SmtB family transcr